ncbi:protein kinase [Nocardia sp. NPDC005998]|uniref:serine/threonine-protein kinase n=1 Tax=Nocardia sp. NPDC005998 TaxID=3156894 RepID=UPI0033A1B2DB
MVSGRTVVDGRFELLEPLGSGGMGTVWRAYDLALHREVALKEVRAEADEGRSPGVHRERVLREARALARIGHPNVVAIHHIVDSAEVANPWIVMELVRGQSLADHLADGPLPPTRVAHLGRGILAALRAAHQVGVLHRDIKPANVLLRQDGSPVLTDFGIAAINGMTALTSTGSVVGSLDYVAPERLSGQEGHPASDLWSLGLLLYVAVEGFHPMRRESTVATLAAVIRGEVPPPQRAGALTAVLTAVLVPDPSRRPTAEQVDRMLAQAVGVGGTFAALGTFNAPGAGDAPNAAAFPGVGGAFNTPGAGELPGGFHIPGPIDSPPAISTPSRASASGDFNTPGAVNFSGAASSPTVFDTPAAADVPGAFNTPGAVTYSGTPSSPTVFDTPGAAHLPGAFNTPGAVNYSGAASSPDSFNTPSPASASGGFNTPRAVNYSGTASPPDSFNTPGAAHLPGALKTPGAVYPPGAVGQGMFDAPGASSAPGAFNAAGAVNTPGAFGPRGPVGAAHVQGGHNSASAPQLSTNHPARKPFSRGVAIGLAAAIAVAAVVATIAIVALRPDSTASQAISSTPPTTGSLPPTTRSAGPTSAPVTGNSVDLLTPNGIRQAITALEKVSGSEEFNEATFYPTYANVGAPVKDKPTLFDLFVYRDGTATRKGAGGPLSDHTTVKLNSINWDILPTLLRTAEESLGIPTPTLRYVIVDPSWTFNNNQPTVMVYLTDDYGGAYLAANTDGTVVTMYPRGR